MSFDLNAMFNNAIALQKAGKVQEAKTHYLQLIKYLEDVDISDPELYVCTAAACFDLKEYNEAINYSLKGFDIEPKKDFLEITARSYAALNDLANAINYYEKITELYPDDFRTHYFLSQHYYQKNMMHKAAESFLKASKIEPSLKRTFEPIGNILNPL